MTMWTIQEFCSSTNNWGVEAVKLIAPPPVTPTTATPYTLPPVQISTDGVITGTVVNGSGFYDPGTGFSNRIAASFTGGIVVNSITYDSPTQVTLNLNTTGVQIGYYDVTITNPDGQSVTTTGILTIDNSLPVELASFTANALQNLGVKLDWRTESEVNNYGFEIERTNSIGNVISWEKIGFVEGHGNSNSPKASVSDRYYMRKYVYRLKQMIPRQV